MVYIAPESCLYPGRESLNILLICECFCGTGDEQEAKQDAVVI